MTIKYELTELPEALRDGLNASGGAIATKRFVTGHQDSISLPAANTDAVFGVLRGQGLAAPNTNIANNVRASVMIRGKAILTAGVGGISAGQRVMPEAATGKGIAWTSGKSVGGVAQTDAVADADFEIELTGPGSTAQ
jgi:hypothetical protein